MPRPRKCDHPLNGARTCIPCAQSRWKCGHTPTPQSARPDGTCKRCEADRNRAHRLPEMFTNALANVESLRAEMIRRGISHPSL